MEEEGIIYCRVSSKNQRSNSIHKHFSLESQERICKQYCIKNNIKIIEIVKETVSGKDFNKMKKLIDTKNKMLSTNIKHLIVFSPDRLIRNTEQGVKLLNDLFNNNKITFFVDDNLSYVHFRNQHNIRVSISLAELETKNISHRITNGYKEKNLQNHKENKNVSFKVKKYKKKGMSLSKIHNQLLLDNINVSTYKIRKILNE